MRHYADAGLRACDHQSERLFWIAKVPAGTLFINVRDDDAVQKFAELRDRSLKTEDTQLLTLLDRKANRESVNALENAAMQRGVQHNVAAREEDIEVAIRKARHKLLVQSVDILNCGMTQKGNRPVLLDELVIFRLHSLKKLQKLD
jgi:hypothetical protein